MADELSGGPDPRVDNTNTGPDDLVTALVPSPESVGDLVVLHGWLGTDRYPGFVRLYLTPHLNDYVVIREDDIIGRFKVEDDERHSFVSVRRQATLRRVQLEAQQVQTSFLAGEVAYGQPLDGTAPELPRPGYHVSHRPGC